MHPQRTSIQAKAPDAFEHTLDPAGALEFANEHSGSAAPPAPYNAFAERELACPCSQLSHTPGGDTCRVYRKKNLPPSWVSIGPMPNTMSVDKLSVATHGRSVVSNTNQRPSLRGHMPCKSGSQATPLRCASNSTKVLSSMPYVNMRFWCCSPSILRPSPSTVKP